MAGKNKRRREKRREAQGVAREAAFIQRFEQKLRRGMPREPFSVRLTNGEAVVQFTDLHVERNEFLGGPGRHLRLTGLGRGLAKPLSPAPTIFSGITSGDSGDDIVQSPAQQDHMLLERIGKVFSIAETLVPKRIANEQLGDALEQIHRYVAEGRPKWYAYIKAISSLFWLMIHAIGEISSSLQGKNKKAE